MTETEVAYGHIHISQLMRRQPRFIVQHVSTNHTCEPLAALRNLTAELMRLTCFLGRLNRRWAASRLALPVLQGQSHMRLSRVGTCVRASSARQR